MKLSYRVVLCSVVVLAIALFSASEQLDSPLRQLLTYQTSSSRMVLTNNLCANYPRWSTPPSDTLSLNKEYLAHMNATIPVNGYTTAYLATASSTKCSTIWEKPLP
jgi:hypothetical protein